MRVWKGGAMCLSRLESAHRSQAAVLARSWRPTLRHPQGRLAAVRFGTFRTMFEPEPEQMFEVRFSQTVKPEPE